MAKTAATFNLSDETKALLKQLAAKEDRSQAWVLEKLIKAAADKAKISVQ